MWLCPLPSQKSCSEFSLQQLPTPPPLVSLSSDVNVTPTRLPPGILQLLKAGIVRPPALEYSRSHQSGEHFRSLPWLSSHRRPQHYGLVLCTESFLPFPPPTPPPPPGPLPVLPSIMETEQAFLVKVITEKGSSPFTFLHQEMSSSLKKKVSYFPYPFPPITLTKTEHLFRKNKLAFIIGFFIIH